MHSVSRGQALVCQKNFFCPLGNGTVNGKYFIDYAQQRVESRLNILTAVNGVITMQNLLQNLSVGYEPLALVHAFFQQALRIGLMRPRSTH